MLKLTIGNSVPLSGALSDYGPGAKRAAGLAIDEIKAAIDKAGVDHSVELITVDNRTDPTVATDTARELVERGAGCIVGPWAAPDTLSVARLVAIPEQVTLISPATTIDEMSNLDDQGLVHRTALPDTLQGQALAGAIAEDLEGAKGRSVNVGSRDDAYGSTLADAFARAWEEKGGEIGTQIAYESDSKRLDATAQRLVAEDPDATLIIDFPSSFARLAPALLRTGDYEPETAWGTDSLASTELQSEVPEEAIDGMRGTAPGLPEGDSVTEEFEELHSEDESESGRKVEEGPLNAQTFDAVILCYLAAVAAGSSDGEEIGNTLPDLSGPPGKELDWRELSTALETLKRGRAIDYQGASGPLDLDLNGDPTTGVYDIYEHRDGELRITDEVGTTAAQALK